MPDNNPYGKASSAYNSTGDNTRTGRDLEATILYRSAQKMETLCKRLNAGELVKFREVDDVLSSNQKIWQIFAIDMKNPDHDIPLDVRNNIASLAVFVVKRSHEILADIKPEKFQVLININKNIAAGLSKKTANSAQQLNEQMPPPADTPRFNTDI